MPDLEILEAKVPARTPRAGRSEPRSHGSGSSPLATWFNGPVFTRARDIFAANMTELLDRAEDPARMIRMIILEMEETLVEVRATRGPLDRRHQGNAARVGRLDEIAGELDREGRAGAFQGPRGPRQAGAGRAAEGRPTWPKACTPRWQQIEQVLRGYEADIAKLQDKLREARARQNAIAARIESAVTRAKAREMMHGSRTLDAFAKFELLERRADFAEGRADALGLTGPKSLEEEIAELRADEKVDAELEAMKAALAARTK